MVARPKVVDASALAAVLFAEPSAERVSAVLGRGRLAAPTLLRYELGSVCLKKIGLYPGQRRALLEALSLLDRMDLRELEVPIEEVVTLAGRERLTVYDASYLWLARALEAELVTLDDRLGRAAARSARKPPRSTPSRKR